MVLDPTETQKPPSNQTRTASGTESWRPRKGRSKRSALPVDISHPAVRPLPPTEREARHFAPSLQRGRSYRRACYTPHLLSAPYIKQKRYITQMGDFLETNALSARSSEIIFSSGSQCTTVR